MEQTLVFYLALLCIAAVAELLPCTYSISIPRKKHNRVYWLLVYSAHKLPKFGAQNFKCYREIIAKSYQSGISYGVKDLGPLPVSYLPNEFFSKMKPLFVLLITFLIAIFSIKVIRGHYNLALSARIAMSAMLIFTSIGHFAFTKGMAMMVPGFIPYKKEIVYLTGIVEIVAAIFLLIPGFQLLTGWFLIIFFVLLLPANINAAIKRIDYQKGTYDASGPAYLWFRVPLQILFIIWVYLSALMS